MMLTDIMTRLATADGSPFAAVEGALELAAIAGRPPARSPAAFVLPLAAIGEANERATAIHQRIVDRVGIVLVLRRHADPRGAAKAADIEALIAWTRASLIGWSPSPAHDPLAFERGALADLADGTLFWLEEYATASYHSDRGTPP